MDGMDSCPKCGHGLEESTPATFSRLRQWLRLPQQNGKCGHVEPDASGWSSGLECECRHRAHGPAAATP